MPVFGPRKQKRATQDGGVAPTRMVGISFDQATHDATLLAFAAALALDATISASAAELTSDAGPGPPADSLFLRHWHLRSGLPSADLQALGGIDLNDPDAQPSSIAVTQAAPQARDERVAAVGEIDARERAETGSSVTIATSVAEALTWIGPGAGRSFFGEFEGDRHRTFSIPSEHSADDRYTFTGQAGIFTITDTDGGTDTLNASATGADSSIDLAPGSTSLIGEAQVQIASGTTIENAVGGRGNDTISGNSADNTIVAGAGNDVVRGLDGDDDLQGGRGNDVLVGGAGGDRLTGGEGRDDYRFDALADVASGGEKRDTVTDFSVGADVLDFSEMDADRAAAGNQSFVWRGNGEFTAEAQLRYATVAGAAGAYDDRTFVYGNLDGDLATAEFVIELIGIKALTAADIVL